MTRFHLIAATALSGVLMFGAAAPALADDAAPARTASGDDSGAIIVTARRTEERLQDVPISITVLSQDAITKRNIYNAGDLASYVPSLSSNANFGPEKSSFSIRGFTQEGKTSPSVAVYFADVVAPRANGGTTSGNGAGPGSFFDLQDIQVLKGPQGTLFGLNTTGGAILLVPAKPTDKLEGSLEGSLGNFNMHRVQGMLNVPLNDTFRVRGAFDWNQRDGYENNVSGIGPARFGNTDYFAGRVSLVGDLTPDLENYIIASYSRSSNNGVVPNLLVCDPAGSALAGTLGPLACGQIARQKAEGGNFYSVQSTNPHPYERVHQWGVIDTTTWKATDTLTLKNIISYAEYREASSLSLFGTNLQLPVAPGFSIPVPTIQLDPGASGYNTAQSTFTEEFQVQGRSTDNRLTYQAGLYLEVSNPLGYSSGAASIFSANCTDFNPATCYNPLGFGTVSNYSIKDTFNDKGIYAQADYKLTDKLILTGGIRYTLDKIYDDDVNVNYGLTVVHLATPPYVSYVPPYIFTCQNIIAFPNTVVSSATSQACDIKTNLKSSRPTWLINLEYKPNSELMAYAKWARGYREGGINPNNLGFPTWGPEKVDTYEVGAKTGWAGTMPGYLNLAGFYNDFRDQQLAVNAIIAPAYEASVPPQQLILNAGKSRIWGIEADAAIRPFAGFSLSMSYAYLNTKLISFNTPAVLPPYFYKLTSAAQVGGPLDLAPKNKVTLTGSYTLPLDRSIGAISLGATFTHTDSSRARSPEDTPLYEIEATDDLNLNADWKTVFGKPFDLSFFVTNVTNEHHLLFSSGGWGTIGGDGGYPSLPRMWGGRIKVHFGE